MAEEILTLRMNSLGKRFFVTLLSLVIAVGILSLVSRRATSIDPVSASYKLSSAISVSQGSCACMADIPGGYCYHQGCDISGFPIPPQAGLYTMRISKTK